MNLGVGVTPLADPKTIVRLAERAEQLGYSQFGAADGWTYDALALLGQIAAVTDRISLETGVISIWSRTPAALAMGAATLQIATDGRFRLGLGASSPPLVQGLHGLQWQQPLAKLRATVTAVRSLLAGARSPIVAQGARALRLGLTPDPPVPLTLAGLTPSSIRLAGELADCWLPFMWARSRLKDGRALLDEGAAAHQDGRPTAITAAVPLALGETETISRAIAAGWLITYLTRMGPLYSRMLRDQFGFHREIDALLAANADGGPPCLPAAAERLAQETTLMATYDQAASALAQWLETDADSVVLIVPPRLPETVLMQMLEASAPARALALRP